MYRQEEKFFFNIKNLSYILNYFKAYPIHPIRRVNSIYFDTSDLETFNDGEEGVVPRKKFRFRWYGNSNTINQNLGSAEIKTTYEHFKEKNTLTKKNSRSKKIFCYFA